MITINVDQDGQLYAIATAPGRMPRVAILPQNVAAFFVEMCETATPQAISPIEGSPWGNA